MSVGVTKIRRKFFVPSIHKDHHADKSPLVPHAAKFMILYSSEDFSNRNGDIGNVAGTPSVAGHIDFQQGFTKGIGKHVRAENVGNHSSIFNPSPAGIPNMERSFPGASGAQLIGVARHPHHPNPHERPSARFFITVSISFSA